MKQIMSSSDNEINNYVNFFMNLFFTDLKNKAKPDIDAKYKEAMNFLQIDIKKSPDKTELHDKIKSVLIAIYNLMKKQEVATEITDGTITKSQFIKKYQEEILGDHKRKYQMNDLYDSQLISPIIEGSNIKDETYIKIQKPVTHEYKDSEGRKINITPVGKLQYKETMGYSSSLTNYIIDKETETGNINRYSVLSSINFPKMSEESYKDAVLNELLGKYNLELSNCSGYIGRIEQAPKDLPDGEKANRYHYVYKVNDETMLVYDATEVSAVLDYVYAQKLNNKGRKSDIGFGLQMDSDEEQEVVK